MQVCTVEGPEELTVAGPVRSRRLWPCANLCRIFLCEKYPALQSFRECFNLYVYLRQG